MLNRLSEFLFGKKDVEALTPPPPPRPVLSEVPSPLKPVAPPEPELLTRNWSHPFGDRSNPLQQLTHLAKAADGYYPVGVHGSWHGGVHFDAGTAGALDQSRVLCLADGEVVAYRIPTTTPTTRYFPGPGVTLDAPGASGFVLVRHRIQAPAIDGSDETPPTLTFYSLYMHLQDWAAYDGSTLERPAYWIESEAKWVKDGKDAPDLIPPDQRGVRVLNSRIEKKTLDYLVGGTQVAISGTGDYRLLENSPGPAKYLDADGNLRGHVAARYLGMRVGELLLVNAELNVRAEADPRSAVLGKLPKGSLVQVSGSGDMVKLKYIEQHVPIAALRSEYVPALRDGVFVPEQPIPIKAGELIGHIGPYQHARDKQPRFKLHLEVFCTQHFPTFLDASRTWAERLPAKERTWLKIAKGAEAVIRIPRHDQHFPAFVEKHHIVGADLLVPKSLLDNLPATHKKHHPNPGGGKKRNWYYLEGLLNDEDGNIVDGWVAETIGETPWFSPWHWEGYEVVYERASQTLGMAYRLSLDKNTSEEDLARLRPIADQWDQGELQSRLYDIIDRNRDRKLSTDEIRTALSIPAHAQALSRIVLQCESEWYYRQEKWDALDQIFGHTTSAPILNWMAEKERIKELSWWGDVMEPLKFREWAVYFLQPVGMMASFRSEKCACETDITLDDIKAVISDDQVANGLFRSSRHPEINGIAVEKFLSLLNAAMSRAGINECIDKAFFIANVAVECAYFSTTEEFKMKDGSIPKKWHGYRGGVNYYGRGLIQLTHIETYAKYFSANNLSLQTPLDKIASDPIHVIGSAVWYWRHGSTWGDMSRHAKNGDFLRTIIGVNGGFNHALERESYALLLIDRLNVEKCPRHGARKYKKFLFSESSLRNTNSGPFYWGKYFGECNEIPEK